MVDVNSLNNYKRVTGAEEVVRETVADVRLLQRRIRVAAAEATASELWLELRSLERRLSKLHRAVGGEVEITFFAMLSYIAFTHWGGAPPLRSSHRHPLFRRFAAA